MVTVTANGGDLYPSGKSTDFDCLPGLIIRLFIGSPRVLEINSLAETRDLQRYVRSETYSFYLYILVIHTLQ